MRALVTGGLGFIGCNLVLDRLARGDHVRILDNRSRPGSDQRAALLNAATTGLPLDVVEGDVRDAHLTARLTREADVVFHLAGQVAVTSSVDDPRNDFEVNALGTLNVLEGARAAARPPLVVYASTNKVYGSLEGVGVRRGTAGYELSELSSGVPESTPLDFHSPYGCSKGAGDQYSLDYARIYRLPTVVFRQSCIYGPWQLGTEDQGWLAHFASAALRGEAVTIFGDGFQVRDVLYVQDLLEAYELACTNIDRIAGSAYNIGGGPAHAVSLNASLDLLGSHLGVPVQRGFGDWRPGDQRVYVSDTRRAAADFGWAPTTSLEEGFPPLIAWLREALAAGGQPG